jgi:CarD family transcriptional regulator
MATKTVDKSSKKAPKAKPAAHPASSRSVQARAHQARAKAPARKSAPAKPRPGPKPQAGKAKPPATKPAVKPTAKAAAKTPPKKPAPAQKAPAKALKRAPKPIGKTPNAKGAKAAKPAAKVEAKAPAPAAPKTNKKGEAPPAIVPVKGKKGAAETQKAAAASKPTKAPTKKKLFVGQKPRTPKPSESIVPSTIIAQQKAAPSVSSTSLKASPAAVEAKQEFKVNDSIVYPAHGVGRIVAIEKQVIAGITNELFLIEFEQEKMKLRVPTAKAKAVGMRGLSEAAQVKKAIELLKGRARIKRTMWSRRAQEYEAKINSGDIIQVAEVVRDLFRASDQPEQSYSERQLFEAALDRLAREVAAVNKSDLAKAIVDLEASLAAKKAAA